MACLHTFTELARPLQVIVEANLVHSMLSVDIVAGRPAPP